MPILPLIKVHEKADLVKTEDFKYAKFPFEKFNPVQSGLIDVYDKDGNFIVASSTSSGKTACFEIVASYEIRERKNKVIYLSPLKSLSQEKLDDWVGEHHFSDLKVAICTGDYRITASRLKELDEADIIIMTSEMLNSISRNAKAEKNQYLQRVGLVAIDECFPANARVRIATNVEVPIKRIYEDDSIKTLLAYDEKQGKIVEKNIVKRVKKPFNTYFVRVKHEYGSFVCTGEHKIWTNKGYVQAFALNDTHELKWVPLSESLKCSICDEQYINKQSLITHYLYGHINPGANAVHIDEKKECSKCKKMISCYGHASHEKYCGLPKKNKIHRIRINKEKECSKCKKMISCYGYASHEKWCGLPQKKHIYKRKSKVCKFCGEEFENANIRAIHEMNHPETRKEINRKISEALNSSIKYKQSMKEMGKKRTGKNNPMHTCLGALEKLKQRGRDRWKNLTEEQKQQQINRFINAPLNKTHGTKLELFVENISSDLPMRRVSGGHFWLTFKNGKRKNPDFKVNRQRKVIEVGDTEYWHTLEEIQETIKKYEEIGYQCLYLTDKDVKKGEIHVRNLIELFLNNHSSKVISVKKWGRGGIDFVYDLEVEDCHNYFVDGVLVSNCHLISSPNRGSHLESGIIKFSEINPNSKFLLLSATMPNVDEVGKWLHSLTGKTTYLLQSSWRPCKLNIHYEQYWDDAFNYNENERKKVYLTCQLVKKYPDDKFICFVHTKKTGALLLEALNNIGVECEYHNANIEKEKRIKIEKRFREDIKLRVLVATSGLSMGINAPARRVIILGIHRGLTEVETHEIVQSAGRAGRPQYDTEGDAYILLPRKKFDQHKARLEQPVYIQSQMMNLKVLAFHLVSEIHHGNIRNLKDIHNWYSKTLAYFQKKGLDEDIVKAVIKNLTFSGCIKEVDGEYVTTSIGTVASMFYYNPFDVADLYKNFGILFKQNKADHEYWVAMALGNTDTNRTQIMNAAEREEMDEFFKEIQGSKLEKTLSPKQALSPGAIKTAYCYLQLLSGSSSVNLNNMMKILQIDFGRTNEVLNAIDSMAGKWGQLGFFKDLGLRVAYGVPIELVEICQIRGIGKVKAKKLYTSGMKELKDITDVAKVIKALNCSKKIAEEVVSEAKAIIINNV